MFLLLISGVIGMLFLNLYYILQKEFAEAERRIKAGTIVNLNEEGPGQRLADLLKKGYYFEDPRDISIIRSVVASTLNPEVPDIDNIGELNKRKFYVPADEAYTSGGESFKKRVAASRSLLGFTAEDSVRFNQERTDPPDFPVVITDIVSGKFRIRGSILDGDGNSVIGVLIRLNMILAEDNLLNPGFAENAKEVVETGTGFTKTYVQDSLKNRQLQTLSAYARSDADGKFEFKGLPEDKAYELLPLQPGFQFGSSQGVEKLTGNESFTFYRNPHTLRLFSSHDFNILKKEKALIVRTPAEFNRWFWIIAATFFAGFLLIHLVLSLWFKQADQLILPLLMILTGLSFITLFSLQDPLRDRFLAKDTFVYFLIGLLGLCAVLFFNLRKFTVDSGLYRMFFLNKNRNTATGSHWGALALFLLLLTIFFGTGPEGSGVKVNLLGFQPGELVKYCIVLFLSGFFAANERFIREYPSIKKRRSFFLLALIAIVIAIFLFLILGDLGPAMVLCFTFIILFSFCRGDFAFMAAAVIAYVLFSWLIKNTWLATAITFLAVSAVMYFKGKQIRESALMALVVIAGFLLIDKIPFLGNLFPGPVQRLVDRKAIWEDAWNNEVFGGDHVANGIWAMSSGGLTGQGAGEGFAKTIPEAHTDMILPSIGEELGWAGIVTIFILYLIYLHRSLIIGRQTGTPFLFYLCAGIGVSTFVQFLLIAGGSTGALPLSGVSLPYISYGGSSMVINLFAAGFLLSSSLIRGTPVQMEYLTKQQDKNLVPGLLAACIGLLLLTVNVSRYQFDNRKWVVKPALVADRSGARMFSYNPRIDILMKKLQSGSIYDRKGLLLATSKPELVRKQSNLLLTTGNVNYTLDSALHKRHNRFYPFGAHMFFLTGDANTGVFTGSINGYFAEYEHAAELRGFQSPVSTYEVTASRFRENRFLPRGAKEMSVSKRDFSAIAPLLLAGINSRKVEKFKRRNRDVQLSLDAGLQTRIQKSLALDDSLKKSRVSVVIMDDSTGDVLASALYPLPPVQDRDRLTMTVSEQNKLSGFMTTSDLGFTYATQPGSTAKLLTALAAFNKLGLLAAETSFLVRPNELIRTRGPEPDEAGQISMERAIVKSNNVYFIKLANEKKLQEEMATLYLRTGMFLRGVGGYFYEKRNTDAGQEEKWRDLWRRTEFKTIFNYNPDNIRKTRARGLSGMAWGQGELIATPASLARLAAGISNKGVLVPNRFVLKVGDSIPAGKKPDTIAKNSRYAEIIKDYMLKHSAGKVDELGISVAGKTGTPERIWKRRRINDGWYVFFAPKQKGKGNIVVCVRIESTKGSRNAVRLSGKHVIPILLERGYIKGFDTNANNPGTYLGFN